MNNQNKKNPLFNETIDFTGNYANDGCSNVQKNKKNGMKFSIFFRQLSTVILVHFEVKKIELFFPKRVILIQFG